MIFIKKLGESKDIQIETRGSDSGGVTLLGPSQSALVAWIWQNKPEMIRAIVCEHCPEHLSLDEYHEYLIVKTEKGH